MAALDIATLSAALSGHGGDIRRWLSYGLVDSATPDAPSTRFNDENGDPLPHGVLIDVTLQPEGVKVPCRVLSTTGGSGEGEFSPFGPGDEVLVAIPDGEERSGCVILGRFSNEKDTFPTTVAGQDVTNNSISFRRLVTPYVMETAASWMVRSAATGASMSIDGTGNILMRDGAGNSFGLTHDIVTLQESTGSSYIQIDPSAQTVQLQSSASSSSAAILTLDDANGSTFTSNGDLQITTLGGGYVLGHAITCEQVFGLLKWFIGGLGIALQALPPITPTATTAALGSALILLGSNPASATILISSIIGQSKVPAFALLPQDTAAINGSLATTTPDITGLLPGIGRPGLLF